MRLHHVCRYELEFNSTAADVKTLWLLNFVISLQILDSDCESLTCFWKRNDCTFVTYLGESHVQLTVHGEGLFLTITTLCRSVITHLSEMTQVSIFGPLVKLNLMIPCCIFHYIYLVKPEILFTSLFMLPCVSLISLHNAFLSHAKHVKLPGCSQVQHK